MNCVKTCKGRVVYNRKPHLWGFKDSLRVCDKSNWQIFRIADIEWPVMQEIILTTMLESLSTGVEYGGGEFGGGGVTRPFAVKGIIEYVAEKLDAVLLYKGSLEGKKNAG